MSYQNEKNKKFYRNSKGSPQKKKKKKEFKRQVSEIFIF